MSANTNPHEEAALARIEQIAPLRAMVEAESFGQLLGGLRDTRAAFLDDALFAHVSALITVMTNLQGAIGKEPAAPAAPEEPAE